MHKAMYLADPNQSIASILPLSWTALRDSHSTTISGSHEDTRSPAVVRLSQYIYWVSHLYIMHIIQRSVRPSKDSKRTRKLKSSSVASRPFHGSITGTQKRCFLLLMTDCMEDNNLYGRPCVLRTGLKAKKSLVSKQVKPKTILLALT